MADIHLDASYFTHDKTAFLIGLLGKGSEVLPIRLWCIAAAPYAETGIRPRFSAQEIEAGVKWWGKPGACAPALRLAGFLDEAEGNTFVIHNWEERARHLIVNRARAVKAASVRWALADSMLRAQPGHAPSNAQASGSPNGPPPTSVSPSPLTPGFSPSNDDGEKRRASAGDIRDRLDAAFPGSIPNGHSNGKASVVIEASLPPKNNAKKASSRSKVKRYGPPASWDDLSALTDLQRVILAWKIVAGVDLADTGWDEVHYSRACAAAADLLLYFKNYTAAGLCIVWVWDDMQKAKRTCTLETVVKHSDRYKTSDAFKREAEAAHNATARRQHHEKVK